MFFAVNNPKQEIGLSDFFQMFPDNESAQKQFEAWRWGDLKRCPHCDSVHVSECRHQKMPFRCKDCRRRFSVRTNSVMAHSNLSYQTWLLAIYIATTGVDWTVSTKLASNIGLTQTSAWHLGQRLQKAWENVARVM